MGPGACRAGEMDAGNGCALSAQRCTKPPPSRRARCARGGKQRFRGYEVGCVSSLERAAHVPHLAGAVWEGAPSEAAVFGGVQFGMGSIRNRVSSTESISHLPSIFR